MKHVAQGRAPKKCSRMSMVFHCHGNHLAPTPTAGLRPRQTSLINHGTLHPQAPDSGQDQGEELAPEGDLCPHSHRAGSSRSACCSHLRGSRHRPGFQLPVPPASTSPTSQPTHSPGDESGF